MMPQPMQRPMPQQPMGPPMAPPMQQQPTGMMNALSIPGRAPQAPNLKSQEMLNSIFSTLPEGSMLKALEAIGIQVKDPMQGLAPDDESNAIGNWNTRRISLAGKDDRGPVWDPSLVMDTMPEAQTQGQTPPYLETGYDPNLGQLNAMQNAPGGF